jgi:hypothetical protein
MQQDAKYENGWENNIKMAPKGNRSEEVNRIHRVQDEFQGHERCNESSVSVNGKYKLCGNYVNGIARGKK